ncbi:diflavin oxidoreductase [Tsukamurella soli]|uniref:diflavin oxidoreductase n=1 Tax=Tsukamurella soli TaxID=644556 RepID=UPI0031F09FBF
MSTQTGSTASRLAQPRWSKRSPYPARLLADRLLSRKGSGKEIRHYELDLGDSGIEYAPGDALAVCPINQPGLVEALLGALGFDGDTDVDGAPLRERLTHDWEISTPHRPLLKALWERDPSSELAAVHGRGDKHAMSHYLWGRDILDLLHLSPGVGFEAAELPKVFRPLQPRAYSISSSPLAMPTQVHLTVATVRYGGGVGGRDAADRVRGAGPAGPRVHGGVCSTYLADRVDVGDTVGVFLQANKAFRLPEDDRPVIMVGPGTGIAPFRGFLHERAARGATGRNWLFFGDRHRATDYLYEEELAGFQASGVLDRLDLAFSRDTIEKLYVQARMAENAAELWEWLSAGACLYVCGDATRMAHDVDAALHRIVVQQGAMDTEAASAYVKQLKRDHRYMRDVW